VSEKLVPRRRMLVFDLDDTLAPSKSPLSTAMADAIGQLLRRYEVAIISGARYEQFQHQVLDRLPPAAALANLHLLPTCGAVYYGCIAGVWTQVYADFLTTDEIEAASRAIEGCARSLGLWEAHPWGERIENRGAQVTFSALGQRAPLEAKRDWDPDNAKKEKLRACVQDRLPNLEVRSGGTTSIDVTRRGIDKAYGVRRLMAQTSLGPADLTFYGDRLDAGGNDYPVRALGIECIEVSDPDDTLAKLANLPDQTSG
jgi:phosphomannomutase